MAQLHDFITEAVKKYHDLAIELSDDLYAHPELPDQEFRSSAKMVDILRQAGYEVEYPYMGYPTAFRAELDNGDGPHTAIMALPPATPPYCTRISTMSQTCFMPFSTFFRSPFSTASQIL